MKKAERITKKNEFDDFIKKNKFIKNNFFIIYYASIKYQYSRFGIAVGTKIGNAVTRNRLKRQVREIIKEEHSLFPKEKDYIIIVRKNCLDLNYSQMKENLIGLISKEKL